MKSMTFWLKTFLMDAILLSSAYFWRMHNVDGAGNLFVFCVWYLIFFKTLLATTDRTWHEKNPSARGSQTHSKIAATAIIVFLAWIGYFWTAAIYILLSMLCIFARHREPKSAKGEGS